MGNQFYFCLCFCLHIKALGYARSDALIWASKDCWDLNREFFNAGTAHSNYASGIGAALPASHQLFRGRQNRTGRPPFIYGETERLNDLFKIAQLGTDKGALWTELSSFEAKCLPLDRITSLNMSPNYSLSRAPSLSQKGFTYVNKGSIRKPAQYPPFLAVDVGQFWLLLWKISDKERIPLNTLSNVKDNQFYIQSASNALISQSWLHSRPEDCRQHLNLGFKNLFPSINFEWKQFWLNSGIINIPPEFWGSWPLSPSLTLVST